MTPDATALTTEAQPVRKFAHATLTSAPLVAAGAPSSSTVTSA